MSIDGSNINNPSNLPPPPQPKKEQKNNQNSNKNERIEVKKYVEIVKQQPQKKTKQKVNVPRTNESSKTLDVEGVIKNMGKEATFSFEKPVVIIPESLQNLSQESLQKLENACLEDYRSAVLTLEDSIADVAVNHVDANVFVNELSVRLFSFLHAYAEILVEKRNASDAGNQANKTTEGSEGLEPTQKDDPYLNQKKEDEVTLQLYKLFIDLFADKKVLQEATLIQGNTNSSGSFGLNPIAIKNAFKEGNLREKLFLAYNLTHNLTGPLLKNKELLLSIQNKLDESKTPWKINSAWVDAIQTQSKDLYGYGAYAQKTAANKLRKPRDRKEIEKLVTQNPSIGDDSQRRIPLSSNEKWALTGNLPPEKTQLGGNLRDAYEQGLKDPVPWRTGGHIYRAVTNEERNLQHAPSHAYLTASEAVGLPGISGISGTLDQILTLSLFCGFSTKSELETGRLACLGWMLDAGDHSYNEIMTSSLSFGLEYKPGPTSYRQIYPADEKFLSKLSEAQKRRNKELPDAYLTGEYALKKATELNLME